RMVGEIVRQCGFVQRGCDRSGFEDGLDLRSKVERAIRRNGVVEWLDAEPIAREKELAPATIPDREREHTAQFFRRADTVALEGTEHGFGIAVRVIPHASRLEVGAQR